MERGVQIEVTQLKRGLLLICSESIRSGIYTEPHRVEARFYADLVKTKGWTHFQRHTKPQLTPYICLPVARSVISAPAEVTALALQGASLSAPQLTQGSSARCKPEREQRTPWWLARAQGSACADVVSPAHALARCAPNGGAQGVPAKAPCGRCHCHPSKARLFMMLSSP